MKRVEIKLWRHTNELSREKIQRGEGHAWKNCFLVSSYVVCVMHFTVRLSEKVGWGVWTSWPLISSLIPARPNSVNKHLFISLFPLAGSVLTLWKYVAACRTPRMLNQLWTSVGLASDPDALSARHAIFPKMCPAPKDTGGKVWQNLVGKKAPCALLSRNWWQIFLQSK